MRKSLLLLLGVTYFISSPLLYGQDSPDIKEPIKNSGITSGVVKCNGCELPAEPLSAPTLVHVPVPPLYIDDNNIQANILIRLDSMKKTIDAQTRVINELNKRMENIELKQRN
ncbi:hypothetical protein [Yersinia proxima]|uniref:hypothetical protein n=1 Tax=Yersinia proxima TaxID=2890316 RepID=UPI000987812D|nr:hypothetical protein [Yersinia proxima]